MKAWLDAHGLTRALSSVDRRIKAGEGLGGYVTTYDFGTSTPAQNVITDYVKGQIWPLDAASHADTDIFNGTRVVNMFDGHTWILANTLNTQPAVFIWEDVGSFYVSTATNTLAGIIKGDNTTPGAINIRDAQGNADVTGWDTKQDAITATGADNVLTAPTYAGGQPGVIPIASIGGRIFALAPDYSKQESTNRITANNGTWTADRDGFVNVSIQAMSAASALCTIRGVRVGQAYSGTSTGSQAFLANTYDVSVGDVVKLYVDGGTATNISCFYVPPKIIALQETPTLANSLTTMGVPDTTKQETTNRISTNNGSWTVDRDGYVTCTVVGVASGTQDVGNVYFRVNGVDRYVGLMTGALQRITNCLPVKKGDIVSIYMDSPMFSAIRCWYVPPVINPPLYVDGDALLNYSTQEQDTGITDTDGRTIWQKTVTGNIAAAADAATNTQLITGVYGFIKAEGWIQTGDDANLKALPMGSPNYAIAYVYKNAAGNSVSLYSDVHASRSSANNGYRITLWYTKN